MNLHVQVLVYMYVFFSLGHTAKSGIVSYMVMLWLTFRETVALFLKVAVHFTFPPRCVGSDFCTSSPTLVILGVFKFVCF